MEKLKLIADSDYRGKILYLSFAEGSSLESVADVKQLKSQWLSFLSSWHSPYKALLDCRNLTFKAPDESVLKELEKLKVFLGKFFLRKATAFGLQKNSKDIEGFPFELYCSESDAAQALGIRDFSKNKAGKGDLRSLIFFDNHFKEHMIELSFTEEVHLKTKKDLNILKSKLMNNLMLWHSSWKLLVDCSKLRIDSSLTEDFSRLEKSLRGFFLKEIVGYSPYSRESHYPFPLVRSRHKAILKFEGVGEDEGSVANCASRKLK